MQRVLSTNTASFLTMIALVVGIAPSGSHGDDAVFSSLDQRFATVVAPFLKDYCVECHGSEKQEGKLTLTGETSITTIAKHHQTWEIIVDRLVAEEMPPKNAARQPSPELRTAVIEWSRALNDYEAKKNAGDPGTVLARRLSNAEYDYTIRDLVGHDIRPTREFPVDPANEAGFDNSGESLTTSPALVKKYVAAARFVADHLVLTPSGFLFAPHPAVTETDRDKFCVHRIVDFYHSHDVDYADYFYVIWRYEHRVALGKPNAKLIDFVSDRPNVLRSSKADDELKSHQDQPAQSDPPKQKSPLSRKYLKALHSALTETETVGPLAELQKEWRTFSNSIDATTPLMSNWEIDVDNKCVRLRDRVIEQRKSLDTKVPKLDVNKVIASGSQPMVLWWNHQMAIQRMTYKGNDKDEVVEAAFRRFCRLFPNKFVVISRPHHSDPKLGAQVRLLSAGFHLMQGYFRDDEPLCELVLDESEKSEIDSLWKTLNFVTLVPFRQYKDYLFAERAEPPQFADSPEFDFARPENKDVTLQSNLDRMRDLYIAKARMKDVGDDVVRAIETYFANISADMRWIEQAQMDAQSSHIQSLMDFAERAYRRPISSEERDELRQFYHTLRDRDGLNHEDAIRDSVISILLSPYFCYRFDLASPNDTVKPLDDIELANRLSYFLWSSMPDEELFACARRGELHNPSILVDQAHRMLRDKRIRGLATEFAGNWLEFRRFEEHNGVDRQRFPQFTNELRQSMYEEPLRLFIDIACQNRSLLEFLDSDSTFVNPTLAAHYGMNVNSKTTAAAKSDDGWERVEGVKANGRGGLLTMSAFLTKNSPGLRTSPVKRGYWVVRRLLGEHIPAPPPEVPELPKDEAELGELTLPQVLSKHRDHKACAGCHQRFDAFGLSFEGYGPLGELRKADLGGRPVESKAIFPDDIERDGVEGLRSYLIHHRRDDFLNNFCRKLFSYAIGRSLLPSDRPTIDHFKEKLATDGNRFETLIDSIIVSPQFLNKRGTD